MRWRRKLVTLCMIWLPVETADTAAADENCLFPADVKMTASLTIEAIPPFLYQFLYMDAEIIWSLFPQQQLQQVQLSLQLPEQRCEPG